METPTGTSLVSLLIITKTCIIKTIFDENFVISFHRLAAVTTAKQ